MRVLSVYVSVSNGGTTHTERKEKANVCILYIECITPGAFNYKFVVYYLRYLLLEDEFDRLFEEE